MNKGSKQRARKRARPSSVREKSQIRIRKGNRSDKPRDSQAKKESPEETKRDLGTVFNEFARELSGLRQCFEISSRALDDAQEDSAAKAAALLEKFRVSKTGKAAIAFLFEEPKDNRKSPKDSLTISFSVDDAGKIAHVLEVHVRALQAQVVLGRSLLLASISQYDAFLGRLLEFLFLERPELLNASNRTVEYSEILRMASFDELRSSIIQKEIETFLRDSHSKQFDSLESRFGLKLRTDLTCWPDFVELTERRNLFAHGDGVVTPQYLKVCKEQGVYVSSDTKVGSKLKITRGYLLQAIDTLYELSMKLTQVLWRKVFPQKLEDTDHHLIKCTFDLIKNEQYSVAKKILETFLFKTNKPLSSERSRRICILNYAQSLKWMNDQEGCNSAVAKEDWTACGPEYSLAISVLRDDFKSAASWMARLGKQGPYRKAQYLEWPIFKRFKEAPEFLKQYEEVYGEPFEVTQREEIERLNQIAESANVDPSALKMSSPHKAKMH